MVTITAPRRSWPRRPGTALLVVGVAAGLLQVIATRLALADPNASTDDRSVAVATKSWSYSGITATAVQADLTANKARLTQLEVNAATAPETFTVVMVANTGAYKVATWWWYVDRSSAQLAPT